MPPPRLSEPRARSRVAAPTTSTTSAAIVEAAKTIRDVLARGLEPRVPKRDAASSKENAVPTRGAPLLAKFREMQADRAEQDRVVAALRAMILKNASAAGAPTTDAAIDAEVNAALFPGVRVDANDPSRTIAPGASREMLMREVRLLRAARAKGAVTEMTDGLKRLGGGGEYAARAELQRVAKALEDIAVAASLDADVDDETKAAAAAAASRRRAAGGGVAAGGAGRRKSVPGGRARAPVATPPPRRHSSGGPTPPGSEGARTPTAGTDAFSHGALALVEVEARLRRQLESQSAKLEDAQRRMDEARAAESEREARESRASADAAKRAVEAADARAAAAEARAKDAHAIADAKARAAEAVAEAIANAAATEAKAAAAVAETNAKANAEMELLKRSATLERAASRRAYEEISASMAMTPRSPMPMGFPPATPTTPGADSATYYERGGGEFGTTTPFAAKDVVDDVVDELRAEIAREVDREEKNEKLKRELDALHEKTVMDSKHRDAALVARMTATIADISRSSADAQVKRTRAALEEALSENLSAHAATAAENAKKLEEDIAATRDEARRVADRLAAMDATQRDASLAATAAVGDATTAVKETRALQRKLVAAQMDAKLGWQEVQKLHLAKMERLAGKLGRLDERERDLANELAETRVRLEGETREHARAREAVERVAIDLEAERAARRDAELSAAKAAHAAANARDAATREISKAREDASRAVAQNRARFESFAAGGSMTRAAAAQAAIIESLHGELAESERRTSSVEADLFESMRRLRGYAGDLSAARSELVMLRAELARRRADDARRAKARGGVKGVGAAFEPGVAPDDETGTPRGDDDEDDVGAASGGGASAANAMDASPDTKKAMAASEDARRTLVELTGGAESDFYDER